MRQGEPSQGSPCDHHAAELAAAGNRTLALAGANIGKLRPRLRRAGVRRQAERAAPRARSAEKRMDDHLRANAQPLDLKQKGNTNSC
jgi:hypothetical protein